MAEVANPASAAPATNAPAPAAEEHKKLEKPTQIDKSVYEENLKRAQKEHDEATAKFNAIRAKLDIAQPTSKDSPSAKRRNDLITQLKEIRAKQSEGKSGRGKIFDTIKRESDDLKQLINAQNEAKKKTPYKSLEDLDREIERLEKQVNGGMMKLVEEKQALATISSLRKQRKGFSAFEDQNKKIEAKKAIIKSLKDTLDDPESKALSDKYNELQAELDTIKAEQDEAFKSIKELRDERTKLHDIQQEKYLAIRKIKDDYFQAGRAVQKWEYEARQKARERKKAENEKYHAEKKKERAQQMLEEASDLAYLDEIRRAESLLRFFDPSYSSEKAPLQAPSQFQATAQRHVDDSGLKGVRVVRKEDKEEDYFAGKGGKKNKKNKKAAAAEAPAAGKFSVPPSVMEDCSAMSIDPPMSPDQVPAAVEKIKEKLEFWKKDQAVQTAKNIAKAKKEVERLEAEEAASIPGTPTTPHANGETKATASVAEGGSVANEIELTKEAEADVVADLKKASLEDKE